MTVGRWVRLFAAKPSGTIPVFQRRRLLSEPAEPAEQLPEQPAKRAEQRTRFSLGSTLEGPVGELTAEWASWVAGRRAAAVDHQQRPADLRRRLQEEGGEAAAEATVLPLTPGTPGTTLQRSHAPAAGRLLLAACSAQPVAPSPCQTLPVSCRHGRDAS